MTTPPEPPGEPRDDRGSEQEPGTPSRSGPQPPQHHQPQGPGPQGPQGPYGPPPPGYGWPPPPQPPKNTTGIVVAMTFVGLVVFVVVNFAAVLLTLTLADTGDHAVTIIGAGALILAAFALGGGAGLVFLRKPWSKGLGLGLMIGWALVSIVSVGYCTGINPSIYAGGVL